MLVTHLGVMTIRIAPGFGDDVFRQQVDWRLRFSLARFAPRLRTVMVSFRTVNQQVEVAIALVSTARSVHKTIAQHADPQRALDWALDHLLRELAREAPTPSRGRS